MSTRVIVTYKYMTVEYINWRNAIWVCLGKQGQQSQFWSGSGGGGLSIKLAQYVQEN